MPDGFSRCPPNTQHNAHVPTVHVYYRYHPLFGMEVRCEATKRFAGGIELVIVLDDGTKTLIPEWMTEPAAEPIECTDKPSISIRSLREVLGLLDVMFGFSHGELDTMREGTNDDKTNRAPSRSVQGGRGRDSARRETACRDDSEDRCASGRAASPALPPSTRGTRGRRR